MKPTLPGPEESLVEPHGATSLGLGSRSPGGQCAGETPWTAAGAHHVQAAHPVDALTDSRHEGENQDEADAK